MKIKDEYRRGTTLKKIARDFAEEKVALEAARAAFHLLCASFTKLDLDVRTYLKGDPKSMNSDELEEVIFDLTDVLTSVEIDKLLEAKESL